MRKLVKLNCYAPKQLPRTLNRAVSKIGVINVKINGN
jgi:hypothetical protein